MDFFQQLNAPLTEWQQLILICSIGLANLVLFSVLFPIQQADEPDLHHLNMIDDYYGPSAIGFWANIYVENNLSLRGLSFEQFMANPRGWVNAMLFHPDNWPEGPQPLLPAQVVVYERQLRTDLDAEELERLEEAELQQLETLYHTVSNRGGRVTSSMSGHKQPRKWQTRGTHLKPV